jgi:hypothetical protein
MEKINHYHKIIVDLLKEHAKVMPANLPGIQPPYARPYTGFAAA